MFTLVLLKFEPYATKSLHCLLTRWEETTFWIIFALQNISSFITEPFLCLIGKKLEHPFGSIVWVWGQKTTRKMNRLIACLTVSLATHNIADSVFAGVFRHGISRVPELYSSWLGSQELSGGTSAHHKGWGLWPCSVSSNAPRLDIPVLITFLFLCTRPKWKANNFWILSQTKQLINIEP